MTPPRTRPGDRHQAQRRVRIAEKYFEVAELLAEEDGASVNVCVGVAVLSGIASADAICMATLGKRSASTDHSVAVTLLRGVDPRTARSLTALVGMKSLAHYGHALISVTERTKAIRAAEALLDEARRRVL